MRQFQNHAPPRLSDLYGAERISTLRARAIAQRASNKRPEVMTMFARFASRLADLASAGRGGRSR